MKTNSSSDELAATRRAREDYRMTELATPSLLAALRETTAGLHREVERLPLMERLLGPLELDDYLEILRRLWRFHSAQEARLAHGTLPQEFRRRPNVELLKRDLHGITLDAPEQHAPATAAESLGEFYLLECSALGGAVIARHVARWPALSGRIAFFGRAPQEVAARWREFCALLTAYDARPDAFRRDVLQGAQSAFAEAKLALGDE